MATGSEILKQFIETNEIECVFGNPGTTETQFLSALTHCPSVQYILGLQESTVIGVAAGYAMVTKKPALVNVHTYPGLANSLCNLYNAFTSGIPLLITAGQQDRRHLVHQPVLSGNLTGLAETAVKYACEVQRIEDLALLLQRCYVQSMLAPAGPTFISLPMDLLNDATDQAYFKKTQVEQAVTIEHIACLSDALIKTKVGKLVFVADHDTGASNETILALEQIAKVLGADIYTTPFHVRSVVEDVHTSFKGHLPSLSGDTHEVLSNYDTIVLLGEKVSTFLFTGKPAVPKAAKLIQISPATKHLGAGYPCDLCVLGDIGATLRSALAYIETKHLPARQSCHNSFELSADELQGLGKTAVIINDILSTVDCMTPIVTEGSSEDGLIQKIALHFNFRHVHFSPRGGGLGWAMPLATGIALASKQHTLCFVGDGGSLYAMHSIWTAAKYNIPVIFICFINQEYRILKDLWCRAQGTTIENTQFIGLDFDPPIDFMGLAKSFGAKTHLLKDNETVPSVMQQALQHQGPSFIGIPKST